MGLSKKVKVEDFEKSSQIYYNEIANLKPLKKTEELQLWDTYKRTHDLNVRNRLIESNLKFVASIANMYKGRGLSYGELIAEGNVGLMRAIDKFDITKGFKMTTYSVWWIKQSILEALERRNNTDSDEYPKDYEEPLEDDITNEVVVENPQALIAEEDNSDQLKSNVIELMNALTSKEKDIVSRYFGLFNYKCQTLEEIGVEYDLTKERVRQIIEKAKKKMRSVSLNNSYFATIY